jgi:hypothetical protein
LIFLERSRIYLNSRLNLTPAVGACGLVKYVLYYFFRRCQREVYIFEYCYLYLLGIYLLSIR